jgi:hypothetical protein
VEISQGVSIGLEYAGLAIGGSNAQQKRTVVKAYGEALQQQHREKQTGLVFHHKAAKPLCTAALRIGEGEKPRFDIRVSFEMIRMTVMPVVFLGPPAITDSGQQGT